MGFLDELQATFVARFRNLMHLNQDFPLAGNLHVGRLLPPAALAQACASAKSPMLSTPVWCLALHLPDELVGALESDDEPPTFSLVIIESRSGVFYPVLVAQAGDQQIRTVLSLSDGGAAKWLEQSVERGAIRLMLLGEDMSQFTIIETECAGQPGHIVKAYAARSAQLDLAGRIADAAGIARRLFDPNALASNLSQLPPREVHVVLVSTAGTGDGDQRISDVRGTTTALH